MIRIIDYGMGNLRSVQKALEVKGAQTQITQSPQNIAKADKIILPGVGAMKPAMEKLAALHLIEPIKKFIGQGRPFLGICLGLQLLFEKSDEGGDVQGLGILKGKVKRFTSLKVPHMGWNQLHIENKKSPLFADIAESAFVYFCHSYYVEPAEKSMNATITDYGIKFTSSITRDNILGVQFHPEKSQDIGLKILKNFIKIKP